MRCKACRFLDKCFPNRDKYGMRTPFYNGYAPKRAKPIDPEQGCRWFEKGEK